MLFLETTTVWEEPKVSTECFYFTYYCHPISVIPSARKYLQRMRAIRDINKLINEIESHENEWKNSVLARRNKFMLRKWKEQSKVSGVLRSFYNVYVTCCMYVLKL